MFNVQLKESVNNVQMDISLKMELVINVALVAVSVILPILKLAQLVHQGIS